MKFRLLREADMTEDLWQAFNTMRDANPIYDDPFFDPLYAQLVAEVRYDVRFAVAFDNDTPVGFWPLHRRPGAWARPIGGPFSDWHGPVLSRGTDLTPHRFLRGVGLLGMSTYGWLPQTPSSEQRLSFQGANLSDLSQGWDSFIENQAGRWPKHYKKMRRLGRNLDRDFSDVEFRFDDVSETTFRRLIELKREQFRRTGRHDVLAPLWSRRLIDRLRRTSSRRFRLRLCSLYFDGQHAASELVMQSDKIVHGWITAFEPEFSQYSAGNVLVQNMLERMSQSGPAIYDAGPGLDHYKRHYSNFQLPIGSGVVRAKTFAMRPDRVLGQAWRSGERFIDGKLSTAMTQSRRRLDQICLSEIDPLSRMNGLTSAFTQKVANLELAEPE
ncbi:MAG: GNAT family N-acetyltransferase [Henriciella sp.]|uniref:GNAT family N-acetyltransferase n=1 Tax=Henriciella sp. TaxID=1968823 RepID=UPI003C735271